MTTREQPMPNLTLDDLVDLLGGDLDDLDNGIAWGADHADTVRTVHDRLRWIVRGEA
jgi:hypothetical protein